MNIRTARPVVLIQVLACGAFALCDGQLVLGFCGQRTPLYSMLAVPPGASSAAAAAVARAGSPAPDFTLPDGSGNVLHLGALHGRRVLLSFMCGCDRCTQLAPELERVHRQTGAPLVLGITAMNTNEANAWGRSMGVTFPLLTDPNHEIAEQYLSTRCPRCWLIDEQGGIVFATPLGADPKAIGAYLREQLADPRSRSANPARRSGPAGTILADP